MTAVAWPPERGLVLGSPLDVCELVDDLPEGAVGELVFAGPAAPREGVVYVERGRVCWAAARGLSGRLTDLLRASAHLDAASMESLYAACQRERTPIGEYLVSRGLVSAEGLRAALLQHTAESLHALCLCEAEVAWLPRGGGGYSPRFTFATVELLPRALAVGHAAIAGPLGAELADAFVGDEWGAAFTRSAARGAPDPVAVHGPLPASLEELLGLGRWASSSLDVAALLHDDRALVATMLEGGALVAWRFAGAIVAGWMGAHGPARLLNRRAQARRKDGRHGGV